MKARYDHQNDQEALAVFVLGILLVDELGAIPKVILAAGFIL